MDCQSAMLPGWSVGVVWQVMAWCLLVTKRLSKYGTATRYALVSSCLLLIPWYWQPLSNFVSITPAADLHCVHQVPGSGLFLTTNESIQMATYYIPQLGPAPRWASFLENITEEMEDQSMRNVYEDYKFVERNELRRYVVVHIILKDLLFVPRS